MSLFIISYNFSIYLTKIALQYNIVKVCYLVYYKDK